MGPLPPVAWRGPGPLGGPIAYLFHKNSENSGTGFDSDRANLDHGSRIAWDLRVRVIHRPGSADSTFHRAPRGSNPHERDRRERWTARYTGTSAGLSRSSNSGTLPDDRGTANFQIEQPMPARWSSPYKGARRAATTSPRRDSSFHEELAKPGSTRKRAVWPSQRDIFNERTHALGVHELPEPADRTPRRIPRNHGQPPRHRIAPGS